jgi:hypothetical protein
LTKILIDFGTASDGVRVLKKKIVFVKKRRDDIRKLVRRKNQRKKIADVIMTSW